MSNYYFTPDKILYQTGSPDLFVHKSGISTALLLKIDEGTKHDTYLVSSISSQVERALTNNEMSVRGAILDAEEYWTTFLGDGYLAVNLSPYLEEISQAPFLPDTGLGLSPEFSELPDTLINPEALFTLYFQGSAFSEGKIRLSVLKRKIDEAATVIKHAIFPDEFAKRRSNSIDLMVDSLSFGSLAISVLETKVNIPKLQRVEAFKRLSKDDLDEAVKINIENFTQQLSRLNTADKSAETQYIFELLSKVLPSEAAGIDKLSILAPNSTVRKVTINLDEGKQLHDRFALGDDAFVNISGFIDEVNQTGSSIRISRPNGRLVTCKLGLVEFERCKALNYFSTGHFAKLTGIFYSRDRIDLLEDATVKELHRNRPS